MSAPNERARCAQGIHGSCAFVAQFVLFCLEWSLEKPFFSLRFLLHSLINIGISRKRQKKKLMENMVLITTDDGARTRVQNNQLHELCESLCIGISIQTLKLAVKLKKTQ